MSFAPVLKLEAGPGISLDPVNGQGIVKITATGAGSGFTGGPFTAGSVLLAGGGLAIVEDHANLFWDTTKKWLGVGTTATNLGSYPASSRGITVLASGTDGGALEFRVTPDAGAQHVIGSLDFWNGTTRGVTLQVDNLTSTNNARLRGFIGPTGTEFWDIRASGMEHLIPMFFGDAVTQGAHSYTMNQAAQQGFYKVSGTLQVGPLDANILQLVSDSIVVATVDATGGAGTGRVVFAAGTSAPVSAAGTAALKYNGSTNTLQLSNNGAAYFDIGSGSGGITALTGDVTASGSGSVAATIAANAVTFAKMQTIADQRLVGNVSGGTAVPAALTAAQVSTFLGLGTSATHAVGDFLQTANNLSDVANAGTSRTNLGLGSAATHASTDFLQAANNLSDVASVPTSRTNLGLVAIASSGSANDLTSGTLPAGRFPALTGDLTTAAGALATTLATVNGSPGTYTYATLVVNGKGLVTSATSGTTPEVPLTFSTGLTRASNIVTADLSTGKSGGQTLIGGTATGNTLTIEATSTGTGPVKFTQASYVSFSSGAPITSANGTVMEFGATPPALSNVAGAVLDAYKFDAVTVTLGGVTHVTSALNFIKVNAPTISLGSAVTVDRAATLTLSGGPVAGGSVTLTQSLALWVQGDGVLVDASTNGISINGAVTAALVIGDPATTGDGNLAVTNAVHAAKLVGWAGLGTGAGDLRVSIVAANQFTVFTNTNTDGTGGTRQLRVSQALGLKMDVPFTGLGLIDDANGNAQLGVGTTNTGNNGFPFLPTLTAFPTGNPAGFAGTALAYDSSHNLLAIYLQSPANAWTFIPVKGDVTAGVKVPNFSTAPAGVVSTSVQWEASTGPTGQVRYYPYLV